jgi:hypothetical protein
MGRRSVVKWKERDMRAESVSRAVTVNGRRVYVTVFRDSTKGGYRIQDENFQDLTSEYHPKWDFQEAEQRAMEAVRYLSESGKESA